MKKILSLLSSILLISCTNADFEIIRSDISIVEKNEILSSTLFNSEIEKRLSNEFDTKKSESEVFYEYNLYLHKIFNLNIDSQSDNILLTKIISEKEPQNLALIEKANRFKDSLNNIESNKINSIKNNIKENLTKEYYYGIKSLIEVKNSTKQTLESNSLLTEITFHFDNNTTKTYTKLHKITDSKNWLNDTNLNLELFDVINFENPELVKTLSVHKPSKIEIKFSMISKNSIGYNSSVDNQQKGVEIVSKDITDIWNNKLK